MSLNRNNVVRMKVGRSLVYFKNQDGYKLLLKTYCKIYGKSTKQMFQVAVHKSRSIITLASFLNGQQPLTHINLEVLNSQVGQNTIHVPNY